MNKEISVNVVVVCFALSWFDDVCLSFRLVNLHVCNQLDLVFYDETPILRRKGFYYKQKERKRIICLFE